MTKLRGFRFQPVKWMTAIVGILTALVGADDASAAAGGPHILPAAAHGWAVLAITVLTVVLGVIVHGVVTPLAAPRDNGGRPLVPVSKP